MSAAPVAITDTPDGPELRVRVVPRAGRSIVAGVRERALLVRLAAAPVDGAANDALLALLADCLRVPRRAIALVSGDRSRDKRIRIHGLTAREVAERLSAILPRQHGPRA